MRELSNEELYLIEGGGDLWDVGISLGIGLIGIACPSLGVPLLVATAVVGILTLWYAKLNGFAHIYLFVRTCFYKILCASFC